MIVRVLHAVRTLGYADVGRIAARVGLSEAATTEHLLDAEARGWATHSSFAGDGGWSLTEAGRREGERLVAVELDAAGARAVATEVYRDLLPLNELVAAACTAWQLTELGVGERPVTLAATITALDRPARELAALEARLTDHVARFHRLPRPLHGRPEPGDRRTGVDHGHGPRLVPPSVVRVARGPDRHPWPDPLSLNSPMRSE